MVHSCRVVTRRDAVIIQLKRQVFIQRLYTLCKSAGRTAQSRGVKCIEKTRGELYTYNVSR